MLGNQQPSCPDDREKCFTILTLDFFATGRRGLKACSRSPLFWVLDWSKWPCTIYLQLVYLLAKCLYLGPYWRVFTAVYCHSMFATRLFIRLALVTTSMFLLFLPFLLPFASFSAILNPTARIFSSARGLFEDKVAIFCVHPKWKSSFQRWNLQLLLWGSIGLAFKVSVVNKLIPKKNKLHFYLYSLMYSSIPFLNVLTLLRIKLANLYKDDVAWVPELRVLEPWARSEYDSRQSRLISVHVPGIYLNTLPPRCRYYQLLLVVLPSGCIYKSSSFAPLSQKVSPLWPQTLSLYHLLNRLNPPNLVCSPILVQ